jgi:hypothetical protein
MPPIPHAPKRIKAANLAINEVMSFFAQRFRSDAICAGAECAARSTFRDSADRCLWRLVRLRFHSFFSLSDSIRR